MDFSRNVPNYQKVLSLKVYRILDGITVSDHMRKLWSGIGIIRELLSTTLSHVNGSTLTLYLMGSSFEGTTTPGLNSDVDFLCCFGAYEVEQDLDEIDTDTTCFLAIREEYTKPGYVKLLFVINGTSVQFAAAAGYKHPDGLKCDSENRIYACRRQIDYGIGIDECHGPADTRMYRIGRYAADYVQAYKCRKWPYSALAWINRKRKYNWPSDNLIQKMVSFGFFVVPVGHQHSPEKDMEWRISLSLQERLLMQSLNPMQYKVYVLLKIY